MAMPRGDATPACGEGVATAVGTSRVGLRGMRPGACTRYDPDSSGRDDEDVPSLGIESEPPGIVDTGGAGASMFVRAGERHGQHATRGVGVPTRRAAHSPPRC